MGAVGTFTVAQHGASDVPALRDEILPLYAAANADQQDDPFFQPEHFWERLVTRHIAARDFRLVTGRLRGTLIGFAFGSPRDNASDIWRMVRQALPDIAVPGEPGPIYVLREIAVHPAHQRRGYGRALHDALLADRPEPLAQLLVMPDNDAAKSAYRAWGWRDIGARQPYPESPVGDAMVRELR